ncbi:GTPase-activating protein [Starmerella bacillaris]|uniref:Protein transport protein SEC23 n=1 Tax=Starmerella bacillaris TaxID=1247836 RepID=A0AAV5RDS0_STABA|nr:GTPase-activating protein [Starmerella bacillaris]
MNFEEYEDADGVRLAWNCFPSSKVEATRAVVPVSALYTPLREKQDLRVLQYEPVTCRASCRAVLNPFCQVIPREKVWVCPFCKEKNQLPSHYRDISQNSLPFELESAASTVEYELSRPASHPPVFVFVVDLCQDEENLAALRDALIVVVSLLPSNALVGLVTFGAMAQVYELGYDKCSKTYVFRGSTDYTSKQINDMLGLGSAQTVAQPVNGPSAAPVPAPTSALERFLVPAEKCEFQITQAIESLRPDPWEVPAEHRPARCTGVAMSIAISMLGRLIPNTGARIMLFAAGAPTEGPGMVVGRALREPLRSHHDIESDTASHHGKATKFYDSLAKRVSSNGHAVDIFVGCYDQVGLHEMQNLANYTGGVIVLNDAFTTSIFKQSLQRVFAIDDQGSMIMGFNATFDVFTAEELKVSGVIGTCISNQRKTRHVSDTQIGAGGTSQWRVCSITPSHTFGVYFELTQAGQNTQQQFHQNGQFPSTVIQFLTHYQHSSGANRLRVTTVIRSLVPGGDPALAKSFDQEAAAVLMSRIAVYKVEKDESSSSDLLKWSDRMLIKLCQRFADYRKGDPQSFRLAQNFALYPQFMYHLRRSQFMNVFNNSPDETAFYRHTLNREDLTNTMIMIQPTLMSFKLDEEPEPVLLDSVSLQPDCILLLDTFFHILIWHGSTIAQWRKAGYQDQPEYANLKALLEAPRAEAALLLVDRFPLPRFIDTDEGASQARFLLSKLNPTGTHKRTPGLGQGGIVLTDDVNLQAFMKHLQEVAVKTTA